MTTKRHFASSQLGACCAAVQPRKRSHKFGVYGCPWIISHLILSSKWWFLVGHDMPNIKQSTWANQTGFTQIYRCMEQVDYPAILASYDIDWHRYSARPGRANLWHLPTWRDQPTNTSVSVPTGLPIAIWIWVKYMRYHWLRNGWSSLISNHRTRWNKVVPQFGWEHHFNFIGVYNANMESVDGACDKPTNMTFGGHHQTYIWNIVLTIYMPL